MEKEEQRKKSIQDKLTNIKYNCNNKGHLIPNQEKCLKCKEKVCCFICPADVYEIDNSSGETIVKYENCLECGACRISCPYNAIDWQYPQGAFGVIYKNS